MEGCALAGGKGAPGEAEANRARPRRQTRCGGEERACARSARRCHRRRPETRAARAHTVAIRPTNPVRLQGASAREQSAAGRARPRACAEAERAGEGLGCRRRAAAVVDGGARLCLRVRDPGGGVEDALRAPQAEARRHRGGARADACGALDGAGARARGTRRRRRARARDDGGSKAELGEQRPQTQRWRVVEAAVGGARELARGRVRHRVPATWERRGSSPHLSAARAHCAARPALNLHLPPRTPLRLNGT
mmetsp:Transcript_7018/g.23286  ORF Transcript_7018/g.23286 Transcript_7018/m.23286 type:complete len:252 (+) Transcript_7018:973-1728(+)